ncbi:MAG TPA: DUF4118 domain-containing protein, partial [Quisquiliibacterium sp.]|nr:DUF4118 domain-containing protein [Quisquiliibacterium sp.]
MQHRRHQHDSARRLPRWPSAVAWVFGWAFMFALDARIDLANKALVLVLTAAVASIWSGPWSSLVAGAAAVLAFNFAFVPPRGAFTVDLHQHALLLVTMLSVSWIVALMVARLRRHAARAQAHAERSDQLRRLGDALRAADDPASQAAVLQDALSRMGGSTTSLLLVDDPAEAGAAGDPDGLVGSATPDEADGLKLCVRDGRAMGPGTGRHEEQAGWYLPLRGREGTLGAALMRLAPGRETSAPVLEHAQTLCDQMGAALERAKAVQAAVDAREQARAQALRNTLLAAISHDHRTPLATILGAASALHDQGERLSPEQRRRLAATIVDEASQLSRLTDNTLQLARLGSAGLALHRDWESVEEIVGTVLRRVRQRDPGQPVKARVEPGLPLLRCDAVLMTQLLQNLVDNALEYGGRGSPVDVVARRVGDEVSIAVRDRGPGVPPALRERIFETFQRGEGAATAADAERPPRRGAG